MQVVLLCGGKGTLIRDVADDGELMAYRHDGFWHAMDSSRDYNHLNDLWASGQAPWNPRESSQRRRAA